MKLSRPSRQPCRVQAVRHLPRLLPPCLSSWRGQGKASSITQFLLEALHFRKALCLAHLLLKCTLVCAASCRRCLATACPEGLTFPRQLPWTVLGSPVKLLSRQLPFCFRFPPSGFLCEQPGRPS